MQHLTTPHTEHTSFQHCFIHMVLMLVSTAVFLVEMFEFDDFATSCHICNTQHLMRGYSEHVVWMMVIAPCMHQEDLCYRFGLRNFAIYGWGQKNKFFKIVEFRCFEKDFFFLFFGLFFTFLGVPGRQFAEFESANGQLTFGKWPSDLAIWRPIAKLEIGVGNLPANGQVAGNRKLIAGVWGMSDSSETSEGWHIPTFLSKY